jgi:hypothetical protein
MNNKPKEMSYPAPFGYIHCRDIQNLAVLKWLAENAADHPESVTNIVGRSREYPTFVHMPQKVQGFVSNSKTSSVFKIQNGEDLDKKTAGMKRRTKCDVYKTDKKKVQKRNASYKTINKKSAGKPCEDDTVVWTKEHSSIGVDVAMYFNIDCKIKLYKGTVVKYGLPSKEGAMDHLYGIRFDEDGDECDWDQSEYENGLKDFTSFGVECPSSSSTSCA